MIETQIKARGVSDPRVLAAMGRVPRERFVPANGLNEAYEDHPLPIGQGQTISQPFIVAYMAQALGLGGQERILEVGTGCGYMAAVLSLLAKEVYGVELEPVLHRRSLALLAELGYANLHLRYGDGREGWPEEAPFDAILLSCAAERIPAGLWKQLRAGGRMLLPLATPQGHQRLVLLTKTPLGREMKELIGVVFVPLR
ncbi:MAG: protein-L-isoaspartate O-methyltransferase [Holophagaceae bacterium]|nr:protein-L-isoaspartate O-methyltransferase [Holophagaceae bacterium]